MDHKVNGMIQHDWGWQIAIYLFLGGVGGGAYTLAAINSFLGEGLALSTTVGLWIAFPALLIGTIFLITDLGTPNRAMLAAMKPGSSWISRGTMIISAFMVLSFVHLVLHQFTEISGTPVQILSVVCTVFAIGTMAYTGILLGASKGVPFWRTGAVPVLFVISATVTGHFAILLGVCLVDSAALVGHALHTMTIEAIGLVVIELLAILFFLQAAYKTPDTRESAERILAKPMFVVGYFIVGLALPLVLMLVVNRAAEVNTTFVVVGSVLGLVGGLILRQAVLICGALPTMNMAGFKFRRIHRPKIAKPAIGDMPPT